MAISFVGSNTAAGTSITIPPTQAGDLVVITAVNSASTFPTVPGTFTSVYSGGQLAMRFAVGTLVATGTTTLSGTWTNANFLTVHVFRDAAGIGVKNNGGGGVSSIITYYDFFPDVKADGTSWVVGVGYSAAASDVNTPPVGMTNRSSAGTGPMVAAHDTAGGVATWPATNVSLNASGVVFSVTFEVLAKVITAVSALAASASVARQSSTRQPSFVGYFSSATSALAVTGIQAGDIIVVGAYRNNVATAPTLASGFTQIQTGAGNTNAMISGWKKATGTSDNSTWTNATNIEAVVYRNSRGVGSSAQNGSTGTAVNYPALVLNEPAVASWVGAFVGHRTATNVQTAPTPMTNRGSQGTGPKIAAHDTTAVVGSWASTNVTVNASSGWRTTVFEVLGPPTVTSQSLAAASAAVARLTYGFGKYFPASSAAVARATTSLTKVLRASSASVATVLKSTSKTFLAASASNARLNRGLNLAFFAASNAVAAILAVFVPGGLAFQASSASVARESHQSTLSRSFLASSSSVATLQRIALLRLSFSASTASVPRLTKSTAKTFLAASLTVALMFRTMPKSFSAQSAAVATLNRAYPLVLLARSAAAASMMTLASKLLQASSAAEARVQKATEKRLQASSAAEPSIQRTLALNLAFQALSQAVARFNVTYQLSFVAQSLSRAWFSLVSFIVPRNVPSKRTVKPSMRDRVANPERSRTVTPRRRNRIVTPD